MKWFINKENKIPLYLQLKDLVKYHISTGAIQYGQQLPTVHGLGKDLGVNFDTVRKAYKDLEREGLVSTKRGLGTFVNGSVPSGIPTSPNGNSRAELVESLRRSAKELLHAGTNVEEIKDLIDNAFRESLHPVHEQLVLFAECNSLQAREISETLRSSLGVNVRPVLLKDLKEELATVNTSGIHLLAVITTGFHINEVRSAVEDMSVQTDYVIANMSPQTRRELDGYVKKSRFGFVCRDLESKYYKDILQTELDIRSEVPCCTFKDKPKLAALLQSVDIVLATPSVYENLKKMAPKKLRIVNVQDRVDPLSLKMLKDRMTSTAR